MANEEKPDKENGCLHDLVVMVFDHPPYRYQCLRCNKFLMELPKVFRERWKI